MLLVKGMEGAAVAALKKRLAAELGSEAANFPGLAGGPVFDADTEAAARRWQAGVGILADGIVGPYGQVLLGLAKAQPLALQLDLASVRRLFPATKPSNIARYLPYVCAALSSLGLVDRPMILGALGTIRAESEGFLPISEYPSQFNTKPGLPPFSAYDGRLGNSVPGDGARYRGRGFVQLTGKANYKTYSQRIGIDLVGNPDWANAPEVASLLLASYLADHAEAMRQSLAAGNYAAARKLVNGGSHGLDRFTSVFEIAAAVWPLVAAPAPAPVPGLAGGRRRAGAGARAAAAAASAMPVKPARALDARKDPADLRDRPYQPPPVALPDEYPSSEEVGAFLHIYTKARLILDQGQEGACTGFGLACVINYARWRKARHPARLESVSPRMLYNFARRYDEYAGEDYDGSSCRGALKGWFHHGVCLEADWPYEATGIARPRFGYAERASDLTLGVYYRIDTKSISDMQAAICEVGAIYVSANTHDGWQTVPVPRNRKITHDTLPVIAFDGQPSRIGGHAFALVGFNTQGFVVQNSWGAGWGAGGFALLRYEDWFANGMDAWVASLGVRGVVLGRLASGSGAAMRARAAAAPGSLWDEARAYEHSVVFGNDGRVCRYLTQDEMSRTLLYQACTLPDQWFRDGATPQPADGRKRIVIYAHGGLNKEEAAVDRARVMGRYFVGNGCYPLFLVWKTGLMESICDVVSDAFQRKPALAGGLRDSLIEASDMLVERTIGRPLARPLWSEMKENAEFCCNPTRGGDLLVTALLSLAQTWGERLEIHLVGHSAGSIMLGHLLAVMAARGLDARVASIHLYAPACTVQFANRFYAPHRELMKRLHLSILSDKLERDDNVAAIYRKSLLYFVSNALEPDVRTPLLGLANVLEPSYDAWDGSSATGEALGNWRNAVAASGLGARIRVLEQDKVPVALPEQRISASHGSFDNDIDEISRTLSLITGQPALTVPVTDLRGF